MFDRTKSKSRRINMTAARSRAALLTALALTFGVCACTFTGAKPPAGTAGDVALTAEELAWFNDTYGNSDDPRSMFLSVLYESPETLPLGDLFFSDGPMGSEAVSPAEWDALEEIEGDRSPAVWACRKHSAGALTDFLARNTGPVVPTPEAMEPWLYLPDEDAYYLFLPIEEDLASRDTAFTAGVREGDTIRLYYEDLRFGGYVGFCLTLESQEDGSYLALSHVSTPLPEGLDFPTVPLSGREVRWWNTEETYFGGRTIYPQFLTCLYDRPQDIDLFQLFYNGAFRDIPVTAGELTAVGLPVDENGQPFTDVDKLPVSVLDEILSETTGSTLAETAGVGLDQLPYSPAEDAYYHMHGDTNAVPVNFAAGERQRNTLRLYYDADGAYLNDDFVEDSWACLTMEYHGPTGTWQVVSHRLCGEPTHLTGAVE